MDLSLYEAGAAVSALIAAPNLFFASVESILFQKEGRSRALTWTSGILLAALMLLLGGGELWKMGGLAWRNLPAGALSAVLILGGCVWALLVVERTMLLDLRDWRPAVRVLYKVGTLISALLLIFYLVTLGGVAAALTYGGRERVVTHNGGRLVEVTESWLDTVYVYYEYHGPLLRGNDRMFSGLEQIGGGRG